ncbi:MAG: M56 family metallopeptidase [Gemmatimonadaceae bacterium]
MSMSMMPGPSGANIVLWMLYSLLVGALVMVAAAAAHDAQRAARRPVRGVWLAAMGLVVALTLLAPLRQAPVSNGVTLPAPMSSGVASAPAASTTDLSAWIVGSWRAVVAPLRGVTNAAVTGLSQVPAPLQRAVALGWLLAVVTAIGCFVFTYGRMRSRLLRWPVRRVDGIDARIAPHTGPAVMGIAPSQVVLPEWLLSRSPSERKLVVTHEAEHIRARDPLLLLAGCIAAALMPWNPALWYALSRLRLAIEIDCDQRVLRSGVETADYGSLLIDLSAVHPARSLAMPAFSFHGSSLEQRLVAMTSRPSRFARSRRALGVVLAVVAVMAACESRLPTSAEIEGMDVAEVQRQVSHITLMDTAKVRYVVDGQQVSEADAKRIDAKRIATVDVVKGSGDSASVGEIRIRTRGDSLPAQSFSFTMPDSVRTASETPRKREFDGLLIVDGKVTESAELNRIGPERILRVEIVKGTAAGAYKDPRAERGVIIITTKPAR